MKFCIWVTKLQQQGGDTNMAIIFTFCSSYLTAFKHQTSKPHPDQALARSSPCYFTKKKIASLLHSDVQKKYLTTWVLVPIPDICAERHRYRNRNGTQKDSQSNKSTSINKNVKLNKWSDGSNQMLGGLGTHLCFNAPRSKRLEVKVRWCRAAVKDRKQMLKRVMMHCLCNLWTNEIELWIKLLTRNHWESLNASRLHWACIGQMSSSL